MMETQIAPIEEGLRAMVVDIVRTCQSTIARNYNIMIAPTSLANDQTQPNSQTVTPGESSANIREESARLPRIDAADNLSELYREPPHLNAEASATTPGPVSSVIAPQNLSSDSGYSSIFNPCACICHGYSNNGSTEKGKKLPNCAPRFPANVMIQIALTVNPALSCTLILVN